jgi:hypothetical protein
VNGAPVPCVLARQLGTSRRDDRDTLETMPSRDVLQPLMRVARILWGALLVAAIAFTVLGVVLDNHGAHAPPVFAPVFAVLAVVEAIVSFVLPANALRNAVRKRSPELAPGEPLPGSTVPTVTFADPAAAARSAFAASYTPFLLGVALSMSVSLLGLALHMVGGPIVASLPLSLFGLALVAVRFPTVPRMFGLYERVHGATFAVGRRP